MNTNISNYSAAQLRKINEALATEDRELFVALNKIRAEICKTLQEWLSMGVETDVETFASVAVDTCRQYFPINHELFEGFVKLVLIDILDKIKSL